MRFILNFLGAIFTALTGCLCLGILAAGFVLWGFGRDLPDPRELRDYRPDTVSQVFSRQGRLLDEYASTQRIFTPIENIPRMVRAAFISAEDKNFYRHGGFDARGIVAAALEAVRTRGETIRGGSTITQQVVKNFLLESERRLDRKIRELILATRLENSLGKDAILELYLNEIFLGADAYGVAAAAQAYFGKTLADLALEEAAYLAALPKAPSGYHPVADREKAVARRNYVLREMQENGFIGVEAYDAARARPLRTVQSGDYEAQGVEMPPRGYFTDEIRRRLRRRFGARAVRGGGLDIRATMDPEMQAAAAAALRAGLEAYDRERGIWRGTGKRLGPAALTAEPVWRRELAELDLARDIEGWHPAVVLELERGHARIGIEGVAEDGDGHWIAPADLGWAHRGRVGGDGVPARAAGDLVDVGDVVYVARVKASRPAPARAEAESPLTGGNGAGAWRWSLRQIPELQGAFVALDLATGRVLAMQGGFSYQDSAFNRATQAARQPGSVFKPFVYATALEAGYSPASIILDAPVAIADGDSVWRPENASGRFYGPTPLRTGIVRSRNIMTVRLARSIGMGRVAETAERLGVYDTMRGFIANALGSQETTLYELVAAYSVFANGGKKMPVGMVDRVQNRDGKTIARLENATCEACDFRAFPEGRVPGVVPSRERVLDSVAAYQIVSMMTDVVETGTAAGRIDLPAPVAGKTGTTNDSRDVWFLGFTSRIVAGCFIGHDTPRSLGAGAYGSTLCAPVFNDFIQQANATYPGGAFAVPEGGHYARIDRYSGARLPDDAAGRNTVRIFLEDRDREGGAEPAPIADAFPRYEAARREEGGAGADRGGSDAFPRTAVEERGGAPGSGRRADLDTIAAGGLY